jgi:hypothetical protein
VSVGSNWLLIVGDLAGLAGSDRFATALYSGPSWTCTAGPFEYTAAWGWTIPGTAQWTIPGDALWTVPGDAVWTVPIDGLWTIPGDAVWTLAGVAVWTIPGDAVWTIPGDVIWTRPKFSVPWVCAACILPWPRPCSRSSMYGHSYRKQLKRHSREIEAVQIISWYSFLRPLFGISKFFKFLLAHREDIAIQDDSPPLLMVKTHPLVLCLICQLMAKLARIHGVTKKVIIQ